MNTETTLVILKPPILSRQLVHVCMATFECNGLRVQSIHNKRLGLSDLRRLYPHCIHQDFWADMVELYTSEDSVILLLTGENAIGRTRDLIGSTVNPTCGTLRYRLAGDRSFDNLVHASDSADSFQRESEIFF